MMRHGRAAWPWGLVVLSWGSSALAQNEIDGERFKPAVTHDGFVMTEGTAVRPSDDRWEFGGFINYAFQPLVVANDNDVQTQIIAGRMGIDLMASLTIAGPVAVGLGVPLYLVQTGDLDPDFGGIGDLRLVPKVQILDDRESIGLAILAELRAPTHYGDFSGGARNVVFAPKLALDHRFAPSGFRIGANLGATIREGTSFLNVAAASEFAHALAAGYRFGGVDGPVELGLELIGGVGLTEQDSEEIPLEIPVYLKGNPSDEWEIVGGPSFGALPGYGVPTFRAFIGVRYTPTSHDRDHDGITDDEDQCPDDAEDRDGDRDADGCPEEDADDDRDGVPNSEDDCPSAKETINGIDDDDGCPDTGDPRVIYEDGEFTILENVQFESGSATIRPESHSLLNQVALHMKANPDIERVRVEGHTDETGSRELNLRLSQQRAESVRQHLIAQGVAPNRLVAKGYGPDQPLASGNDPEAYAKNRRVEFILED